MDSVISDSFLTVAMRWTDRLIGFLSTLVLARLLAPEDFGVIAMAFLFALLNVAYGLIASPRGFLSYPDCVEVLA